MSRRKRTPPPARDARSQGAPPAAPATASLLARTPWLAPVAVLLAALLPYANTLRNGFVFDDVPVVAENRAIRSLGNLPALFRSDWWQGRTSRQLVYRPLAMATFALDHALLPAADGPAPARLPDSAALPFHAQNVLWHAAASLALLLLVRCTFGSPAIAATAALLFAVHPVHTEAVAGIVGRTELMAAAFSFLALAAGRRFVTAALPRPSWLVLAALALLAALLSKENAIVVPLLPLLWLLHRPAERPRVLRLVAALGLVALLYLGVRTSVVGSLTGITALPLQPGTVDVDNPLATAPGAARLFTALRLFGHVLRLLAAPRTLSADYSYAQIPVVGSMDGATLLCLAAAAGLLAGAFQLRRRSPEAAHGILFFFATSLLTSNLLFPIGTILGERLLYLPSAGACIAAAAALGALARRSRPAALVLTILLLGAGAARSAVRNRDWRDNRALFTVTAVTSPRSCKALNGYAAELVEQGRDEEAIALARQALEIHGRFAGARQTLAKAHRNVANRESDPARRSAARAESRRQVEALLAFFEGAPDGRIGLADAWNSLANLELDEERYDLALTHYRRSLELRPDDAASTVGVGAAQALAARGLADPAAREAMERDAVAAFEQALLLEPSNADAHQNLAATYASLALRASPAERQELDGRAAAHEERALAIRRERGDVDRLATLHRARGERLLSEQRHAEALEEFRRAERLQPGASAPHVGIGSTYAFMAEAEPDPARKGAHVDASIRAFERALELDPRNADAHRNLGITYLRQRPDPALVIVHFRRFLELQPDSPQAEQMRGTIREMEGALMRPPAAGGTAPAPPR